MDLRSIWRNELHRIASLYPDDAANQEKLSWKQIYKQQCDNFRFEAKVDPYMDYFVSQLSPRIKEFENGTIDEFLAFIYDTLEPMEKALRNVRLLIGSEYVNKMVEIKERDANDKRRNLLQKERQPSGGSNSKSGLVSKFPKTTGKRKNEHDTNEDDTHSVGSANSQKSKKHASFHKEKKSKKESEQSNVHQKPPSTAIDDGKCFACGNSGHRAGKLCPNIQSPWSNSQRFVPYCE
jgi:hypothetical protein